MDCAQGRSLHAGLAGSPDRLEQAQLSPPNHQQERNQRAFEDGKDGEQE